MDFVAIIFTILAFCGVVSEHLALIVCAVYFVFYIILCFVKHN